MPEAQDPMTHPLVKLEMSLTDVLENQEPPPHSPEEWAEYSRITQHLDRMSDQEKEKLGEELRNVVDNTHPVSEYLDRAAAAAYQHLRRHAGVERRT